jgi:hypothetical protein
MLEAPEWLTKLCGKPAPHESKTPLVELDTDANIAKATKWLIEEAPEAVQGAGGDETTYKVAAFVKDFGISEGLALDLLIAHWNETKASPNWDYDDLKRKVENAYSYGTGAVGKRAIVPAEDDFEPVDLSVFEKPEMANAKKNRLYYVPFDDAVTRALDAIAKPLVKGLLDCSAMSVIYGDSNSGKTFLALDIASHVATPGFRWNGRKTANGLVAYIAAEGGRGVYKRLEAWRRKHGIEKGQVKLALIPCPVDLRSMEGDAKPLVELIRQAEAHWGEKVVLVVVDTLSRALAGGDENSPVDMGSLVRNCDRIRDALDCHLMLIHHTGKNKAAGARGHSLLRAATDTEIEVDNRTFAAKKQRDIEPIPDMRFDLEVVKLGEDGDGDPITSCTVILRTASEFEKLPLTDEEFGYWEELLVALADRDKGDINVEKSISTGFFVDLFWRLHSSEFDAPREKANYTLKKFGEKGWIKKLKQGQWVIT